MSIKTRVLFVCMGNICRSPMAQGVFAERVKAAGLDHAIAVDSAGTHAYHVGEPPDGRARRAARARDVDVSDQRARRVEIEDFGAFDYIVAMDRDNMDRLLADCPPEFESRLRLFLDFAPGCGESEVPDPYYGGDDGFERVLDLVENASDGLLETIRAKHLD